MKSLSLPLLKKIYVHMIKQKVHASGDDEVQAAIAAAVKDNRVVVYMKGTPAAPRCGFSNMVVQILNHQGVEYQAHDVLASDIGG